MRLSMFVFLCLCLFLAACSPAATAAPPPAETRAPAAVSPAAFNMDMGAFEIKSARWVDEINGVTPGPQEKILILELTRPGEPRLEPGDISLEEFDRVIHDQSKGEVHLSGDDGSYIISTMAGWTGANRDQFVIGFRTPKTARTFQLFWPGNNPIEIHPD